jgi:1,4-alpha-glucan branching enzyme
VSAPVDPTGYLALVLHAHLPFVRHPEHPSFLEEDWLFEAMTETYIPLLQRLDAMAAEGLPVRLTMSITPTLCEMLGDPLLQERYVARLRQLCELCEMETERYAGGSLEHTTALLYRSRLGEVLQRYESAYGRDLLGAFRRLQEAGVLEIMTCAATHGFLPLFSHPQCVRAQLRVAVRNYEKHFGRAPEGVWLPECGYNEGLDAELAAVGLRYFFLDSHGLLYGTPRPRYGVYAPVICRSGVAVFGRDIESSRQVWSSEVGYPGDPDYREFYRDLGYDAPEAYIRPYLHADGLRRNLGLKYHRITGRNAPLDEKEPYDPGRARERAAEHAGNFLFNRQAQARFLRQQLGRAPVVVAPYDAELFGHWWYEGPEFLEFFFRKCLCDQDEIALVTAAEYLRGQTHLQVMAPSPSSWGDKGYFEVWLNGTNDWIYRHLHRAEARMVELACNHREAAGLTARALNQAGRELLLAQASDWAFIMTTGTMVEYAQKRTQDHVARFNELAEMIDAGRIREARLSELEHRDNIFPELDFRVYVE